jgi:dihydroxyacetone kinase phosphotransfer subunit
MVNLVIVSHSARLGEGVGELARQMLINDGCKLAIAAGIDDPDSPIGTDPIKVMEAIESVADTDHVLVMMDIGSALLSAETALDLLDPAIAAKVRLCAAPLVEGTLAATVSAASGAGIDKVIADAMNALEAKRVQLGLPSPRTDAPRPRWPTTAANRFRWSLKTTTACTFVRRRSWSPRWRIQRRSGAGERRQMRQTGQPQPNRPVAGAPQRY